MNVIIKYAYIRLYAYAVTYILTSVRASSLIYEFNSRLRLHNLKYNWGHSRERNTK